MKCNNCDKDFEPKRSTAKYCSDACRQRSKRDKVSVTSLSVTDCVAEARTACLEDYKDCPSGYATRTSPDKLNWGLHMDADQLKAAGFIANRVPIPGDWDYVKLEHTPAKYKGKASDKGVQKIWDRHAVQGRPTVYV